MGILITETKTEGYDKAQKDMLMNAVTCEVPYKYIREMITGVKEPEPIHEKEEAPAAGSLDFTDQLALMSIKTLRDHICNIDGDCGKCICAAINNGKCWLGGCPDLEKVTDSVTFGGTEDARE